MGTLIFILSRFSLWPLHYSITVGVMFFVCIIIFVIASRFGEPPSVYQRENMMYRSELLAHEHSDGHHAFYKDYRYQCVGLAMAMLLVLYFFW